MLTEQQLNQIKIRADAATPGPWDVDDDDGFVIVPGVADMCAARDERDRAFIANARTDIPALLDEVQRLRVENARLLAA